MTKASERFFETNYCAAVAQQAGQQVVWFSPSQLEEHRLGYDTLVQHALGVELIQFKVPKRRMVRPRTSGGTPCLRVELPHDQVQGMRRRAGRSGVLKAHFVFPNAVEVSDYFSGGWDVLGRSYSVDARDLARIPKPHRFSGVHLGDFRPHRFSVVVQSEPVEVPARPVEVFEPSVNQRREVEVAALGEALEGLGRELPGARLAVHFDKLSDLSELGL